MSLLISILKEALLWHWRIMGIVVSAIKFNYYSIINMQITCIVNKDLLMQKEISLCKFSEPGHLIWSKVITQETISSHSGMFATAVSLLHADMRTFDIEGASFTPADGQDSFLCCYLPSKITHPPTQYPLLFPPRGKQVARGPYVRLSGCISISRPSLITEINWQFPY